MPKKTAPSAKPPVIHVPSKFTLWPIAKLVPYAKNSRTHSDKQIDKIAASIKKFGFNSAIRIDEKSGILCGHGTILAAAKLGMTRVPVIVLDHLTEAEKRAYIIADNKLSDLGTWDEETLAAELAALREQSFDVEFTGFDPGEIDKLLKSNEPDTSPQVNGYTYRVVVDATDEVHQAELIAKFESEGMQCRALIS